MEESEQVEQTETVSEEETGQAEQTEIVSETRLSSIQRQAEIIVILQRRLQNDLKQPQASPEQIHHLSSALVDATVVWKHLTSGGG